MSKALKGMHYCEAHQGNHSHYAYHNCVVCQLTSALQNLVRHDWEQDNEEKLPHCIELEEANRALIEVFMRGETK